MFDVIKEDFRYLQRGRPGHRFRKFYDFRMQHRKPGVSPARVFNIFLGITLLLGGLSIGWLPGPGGFIAIFGLALLAQEFRPMASALDWCEPKVWAGWQWLTSTWRRLSAAARLVVAMTLALTTASMGYAAYSMLLQ